MAQIQLSLFGTFHLTVDGGAVSRFRSQREAALLAYLAVEADQAHARERLAGLLWPDKPEAVARQNLRQTLTNLRALLHDDQRQPPLLLTERNTVQWNRDSSYTLDVATFRTALAACAAHNHSALAGCTDCQTRLTEAIALYDGPFLHNFAFGDSALFEEWVLLTREHLQQQAQQALSQLCDAALAHGEWATLEQFARRHVAVDPFHEPAQRHLIQALVSKGDRGGALSHFESFAAHLQRELGVEPSPETLALIDQIRSSSPPVHPPQHAGTSQTAPRQPSSGEPGASIYKLAEAQLLEAHPVVPAALPAKPEPQPASPSPSHPITTSPLHDWGDSAPNTLFVGRQAEEEQVRGWLQSGVRVICIWGRSSVGKTALAQAVARSQIKQIPVILWRSVTNAPPLSVLVSDWLTVLGEQRIPETLDRQLHRLFDHLRRQRTLLVLDHLETLLQAERAGRFRPEHELYSQFFQQFAQIDHQSTLILTSREQLELFVQLEEETPALRSLLLTGLSPAASQQLLTACGVTASTAEMATLVERVSGNPTRLKFAAQSIQELFSGDVSTFLAQEVLMYGVGRDLFEQYRTRMPYIDTPDMIRIGGGHMPQEIGINLMLLIAPTQVGCRTDASDAHLAHVPLHGFTVDNQSFPA
jgi:DNA-binding SARP family transcriptional activator